MADMIHKRYLILLKDARASDTPLHFQPSRRDLRRLARLEVKLGQWPVTEMIE
jgi:hypothetical protein